MDAELVRVHIVVRGRVQGVGFRQSAAHRAGSLELAGWVANRDDGALEAVFEGPRERVDSMIAWCRHGPRGARVDSLEEMREAPEGERGFHVEFAQRGPG